MPLTMRMTMKDSNVLGPNGLLHQRLQKLIDDEKKARDAAAKLATDVTRSSFHYKRGIIAPRPGRDSTGGHMASFLTWKDRNGRVEFDVQTADRDAPQWIIQEIGTGQRATIHTADGPNPVGRPKAGATYVRTVKAQRGRRISGGLVFATGGHYSPPGARRDEQLHWASTVRGVPQRSAHNLRGQAAGIRIRNEIQGQHFVQKGGNEGFREYRTSVLAAARQAFRKGRRP